MPPTTEATLSSPSSLQELKISRTPGSHRAPQARVIHSLKQWMTEGELSAGTPLPSERALSEQFQVNRGTVRRALQILQDEGLLRTQNGRTRIVTAQSQARTGALRTSVALLAPLFSELPSNENRAGRIEYIGRGALEAIRGIGKHAMSLNPDCLTREEVRQLASEQPFGVVITDIAANPARAVELAQWFSEAGVPVCSYGDMPANTGLDRVTSDQEDGCYQLTKYLISKGRRRILNFWSAPLDLYWNQQRTAGYERAMREAGLEPLAPVQMPPFPVTNGDISIFQEGTRATVGYLVEHLVGPEPVDALMVSTDNDYFGVAAACRLCGKEPQQEVLIAGYDNYWVDDEKRAYEPTVPVATIDKRNKEMGTALVQLLADRVEGRLPEGPQRRLVKPALRVTDE